MSAPLMKNKTFVRANEAISANISFQELAAGSGIVTLYGARDNSTYLLTKDNVYSDQIITKVTTGLSTSYTKIMDLDFDLYIAKSITLKGLASFNIPLKTYVATVSKFSYTYAIIKVRKWDGVTETEIANVTSGEVYWSQTSNDLFEYFPEGDLSTKPMRLARLSIPKTVYKSGEYLRITIEVYGKISSGASSYQFELGHDPAGRNTFSGGSDFEATDSTKMIFNIPVVVDL